MNLIENSTNPYKNRTLPVGKFLDVDPYLIKFPAMLEYGEKELLYQIVPTIGGGQIANIGCAQGGSAGIFAQSLLDHKLNGTVHTVDIYEKTSKSRNALKFKNWGLEHYIKQYRGKSYEIAFQFYPGLFDLVFVDGDHSYDGVKNDYIAYGPTVRDGGLMLFHDTNQDGVNKVISEYVSFGWELIDWVNRIKVFKRSK